MMAIQITRVRLSYNRLEEKKGVQKEVDGKNTTCPLYLSRRLHKPPAQNVQP